MSAVAEPVAERDRRLGLSARSVAQVAVALAGPGLVTLLAFTTVPPVPPALLYVAAVCAAALAGGTAAALVAVMASFVPFTWFFTPPRHSFGVADASDGAALAAFVVVAVGMSQVVAYERRRAARDRRARQQTEAASVRQQRLQTLAHSLSTARTPQQVLEAILAEGARSAGARAGLIGLLAKDGETIEVVARSDYDSSRFDRWGRFALSDRLPLSEAIRTGEPVYLSSTAERDLRYPLLADLPESSHALTCLPLVLEGRTFGGLALSFRTNQTFDADQRAFKQALALHAAQALDRARLDAAETALRERLSFLAEASELLASSLDYEHTLRRLADLAVPRLADWCGIDMVAEDGSIERLAVAHQDPEKVRYVLELAERYPPDPQADRGVPQVLRSGEPEFIPEIGDDLLVAAAAGDEELLHIIRELGLRSAITVPLIARGRTLGTLSLVAAETVAPYGEADLQLAQDLARRAAVAVDNARLHAEAERRADAARALKHVADAVVLVDHGGRPSYWNDAAARLFDDGAGTLAGWQAVADDVRGWTDAASLTIPVQLGADERWLQLSRTELDDGCVYALRDVSDERLLERTRSDFVATASHELRTPIAAVYGTFQTLLRDDVTVDASQLQRFLQMGLQESHRLARIVDDLLLAGQLDGGSPRIAQTTCDVASLVGEAVDASAARIADSHALESSVDPHLPPVRCDPMRLRQVLMNLIENAAKYSPDGTTISVCASGEGSRVLLEVADEGFGISERDQGRIFDRFVRLDPALTRGVGGAGLGLYICRELVHRMGGTISVRSRAGAGSTFTVELPS